MLTSSNTGTEKLLQQKDTCADLCQFFLNKCDEKLVQAGIDRVPKYVPPGRAYRQLGEWTVQSRDKQKPPQRCRPGPGFRTTELPLGSAFPEEKTSLSQSSGSERFQRFARITFSSYLNVVQPCVVPSRWNPHVIGPLARCVGPGSGFV